LLDGVRHPVFLVLLFLSSSSTTGKERAIDGRSHASARGAGAAAIGLFTDIP